MKPKTRLLSIVLMLVVVLLSFYPTQTALAAPCYGSGCNGWDPAGTSCWDDRVRADYDIQGNLRNDNWYSPSCNANWSYTSYSSRSWLAAETVGVYTYHGDQLYSYVWNSMWDGSSVVCTRGHQGSSYMNYTLHTNSACA